VLGCGCCCNCNCWREPFSGYGEALIDRGRLLFAALGRCEGTLPVFCEIVADAFLRCPDVFACCNEVLSGSLLDDIEVVRPCVEVGIERERFGSAMEETDPALSCLDVLLCHCRDLFSPSSTALRVTGGLEGSVRLLSRGGGGGIDPSLGEFLLDRLLVRKRDEDDELRVTGSLLGD